MKKKYRSIDKKLPPVKMYLDDLEEIILLLEEEGFSDIKIQTKKKFMILMR
jgi:hypothetical protein